jgi:hypothetical protein
LKINPNKESVSEILCLSNFNNKHAWIYVTSWFGIVAHMYILLNFEDEISIRRRECSIPDFRSIIVEILIR